MQDQSTLPDNLKSRFSRIYVSDRELTNDAGQKVAYKRLVLEVLVKGEKFDIEFKPESKDLAILKLADVVDGSVQQSVF